MKSTDLDVTWWIRIDNEIWLEIKVYIAFTTQKELNACVLITCLQDEYGN